LANPPHKLRRLVFIGIALLALAVRLPRLGERPMHTDEAVHAYITGQLLEGGQYHYDPRDRHGPVLYALALPVARLAGAHDFAGMTETMLRVVPAIVGALTPLLLLFVVEQIGFVAAALAALFFAIGPLPVYYSRYFIHETLFVAATLGLLASGWRALANLSAMRGILPGLCAGIMLGCKETALLHFVAFGAAATWWIYSRRRGGNPAWWSSVVVMGIVGLATLVLVTVALYSWGGQNRHGPADLAGSLPNYAVRAGGQGHEKPAWYYFVLLGGGWSGWAVLALAAIGSVAALRRKSAGTESNLMLPDGMPLAGQSLLVYALVICAIYSAIPYKMPWLALNLWLPLALLAGCGGAALGRMGKLATSSWLPALGIAVTGALLAQDTWQRVFLMPADVRNPYAYAHTVEDLLGLPAAVERLAGGKPNGELLIAVVAADPWPLPWYLRKFPRIGYWQPGIDPGPADIYITSLEAAEQLTARLQNRRPEFFGQRPEVLLLVWPPPTD
jgi:uncharacterized protein (TIGR03663 family)